MNAFLIAIKTEPKFFIRKRSSDVVKSLGVYISCRKLGYDSRSTKNLELLFVAINLNSAEILLIRFIENFVYAVTKSYGQQSLLWSNRISVNDLPRYCTCSAW